MLAAHPIDLGYELVFVHDSGRALLGQLLSLTVRERNSVQEVSRGATEPAHWDLVSGKKRRSGARIDQLRRGGREVAVALGRRGHERDYTRGSGPESGSLVGAKEEQL